MARLVKAKRVTKTGLQWLDWLPNITLNFETDFTNQI